MLSIETRQLNLFTEDSLANLTVYPGSKKAKEDDRDLWPEMSRVVEELRPNWVVGEKMLLTSPIWNSTVRYLTWKTSITKQQRLYFQLWPSVPNIKGLEHSLLPTPTASMWKGTARSRYPGENYRGSFTQEALRKSIEDPQYINPDYAELIMGFPDQVDRVKSLRKRSSSTTNLSNFQSDYGDREDDRKLKRILNYPGSKWTFG